MKYIRTKDGVYNLKLKPKYENDKKTIDFFINNYYGGYNNFVNGADTIEELCDEFVFVNKVKGLSDKTYTIPFDMKNHQFTEPTVEEKMDYIKKHYKDNLEKIKKAFEIIKNKKVNVRALIKSFYFVKDGLSVYNSQCCDKEEMESKELTQEEYDFLKEVLL